MRAMRAAKSGPSHSLPFPPASRTRNTHQTPASLRRCLSLSCYQIFMRTHLHRDALPGPFVHFASRPKGSPGSFPGVFPSYAEQTRLGRALDQVSLDQHGGIDLPQIQFRCCFQRQFDLSRSLCLDPQPSRISISTWMKFTKSELEEIISTVADKKLF